MRGRLIAAWVVLAYMQSAAIGAAMWAFGDAFGRAAPVVFGVATMAVPLVTTAVVQVASGERPLRGLGAAPKRTWWLAAAIAAPVVVAFLTTGIGLLLPGVRYDPEMNHLFEGLGDMAPQEQIDEARRQLASMPVHPFWLTLPQVVFAGATINALAAFGEEIGWRGWLHRELAPLGFWRRSALIGAIWGLWHAPLILNGHNYPIHRVEGVLLFTAICVMLAPAHALLRDRAGTVWAAAVFHGTFNAAAGLPYLVSAGSDLLVGAPGLAGALALVLLNVGVAAVRGAAPSPADGGGERW
jgi:membrane protease YdiL (CAAX protease family)